MYICIYVDLLLVAQIIIVQFFKAMFFRGRCLVPRAWEGDVAYTDGGTLARHWSTFALDQAQLKTRPRGSK